MGLSLQLAFGKRLDWRGCFSGGVPWMWGTPRATSTERGNGSGRAGFRRGAAFPGPWPAALL